MVQSFLYTNPRISGREPRVLSLALALAVLIAVTPGLLSAEPSAAASANGVSDSPDFFPIGVWLQPPSKAAQYRGAGFNLFVGLWRGPTDEQLSALKQAGMRVVCAQNTVGLQHLDDPTIAGWMHGDEPDNAQSLGEGKGYGPPIAPERIVADYQKLRARDLGRPVLLNLGQGVAWDDWHGRGVRTRHPEDYLEYVKGADIVSFDIYPVTHDRPAVSSNLWFVARGVERLVQWTEGRKPVWNCIECTRISHPTAKPTPHQVRAEVWMSLIHGSRGLIYFVHEWEPRFDESALLRDPEMLAAVTRINRQIHELAPVLNSPTQPGLARVSSEGSEVPIALMTKRDGGSVYLFAVAMRNGSTKARFSLEGIPTSGRAEVLGEDRTVEVKDGAVEDAFDGWGVHLYRIRLP